MFNFAFTRVLNPLKDIKVLWRLFRLFRKEKFDLVQYTTLKAALLSSIASFFARMPPGDSKALADKISETINDARRLEIMSRTNLAKAMEYKEEVMDKRKKDFCQCIKEHSC